MESRFRRLVAYQLSCALADDVQRTAARWPSFERWTIGIQLARAAHSIGANIAEAAGRWHRADRRRLLVIARGSLYETEHWLLRAEAQGLHVPKREQLDEIARALSGLIRRHDD